MMRWHLFAVGTALWACTDRQPQLESEDAGVAACALDGAPTDDVEALAMVEDLLACEVAEGSWDVTCSAPTERWFMPDQPAPAGDLLVGHEVVECEAVSVSGSVRIFTFTIGDLRLRPVTTRTGAIRCIREGTPSGERFDACDELASTDIDQVPYAEITTLEAAYEHVGQLLACAGCAEDEHQIDCWGPMMLDRMHGSGWHFFACRLSDVVEPAQLYLILPFATY